MLTSINLMDNIIFHWQSSVIFLKLFIRKSWNLKLWNILKIIKNIPLRRKYVIINISDIIDNSSVFNNIPERSNKNITVKYCTIFYQNLRGGGGGGVGSWCSTRKTWFKHFFKSKYKNSINLELLKHIITTRKNTKKKKLYLKKSNLIKKTAHLVEHLMLETSDWRTFARSQKWLNMIK